MEEITTTLEMFNDDAGIDSACFQEYLSFKFRFLQKYFIKIFENVEKEEC